MVGGWSCPGLSMNRPTLAHMQVHPLISEKPMNSAVMVKPSLGKVRACWTSLEWRIWYESLSGLSRSTYFYPPLAGGIFHCSKIWNCLETCRNMRCPSSYEVLVSPASFQPLWGILGLLQAPQHCRQKQLFLPQNDQLKMGSILQC